MCSARTARQLPAGLLVGWDFGGGFLKESRHFWGIVSLPGQHHQHEKCNFCNGESSATLPASKISAAAIFEIANARTILAQWKKTKRAGHNKKATVRSGQATAPLPLLSVRKQKEFLDSKLCNPTLPPRSLPRLRSSPVRLALAQLTSRCRCQLSNEDSISDSTSEMVLIEGMMRSSTGTPSVLSLSASSG